MQIVFTLSTLFFSVPITLLVDYDIEIDRQFADRIHAPLAHLLLENDVLIYFTRAVTSVTDFLLLCGVFFLLEVLLWRAMNSMYQCRGKDSPSVRENRTEKNGKEKKREKKSKRD